MADTNKFLDYAGLQTYDQKIKNYINTHDEVGYDTVKVNSTTALAQSNTVKFANGNNVTISGANTNGESVITISALDEKTSLSGHYSPSGGTNKVTDGGNTKTISSVTVDSKGHVTAVGTTAIAFPVTSVSEGTSVENYVALTVSPSAGDVKVSINDSSLNTKLTSVDTAISNIQSLIAGGVHFRGVVSTLPASPFTGYVNGDIIIFGQKEYILNKPESGTASWVELGDTTAESQRITALEDNVDILRGADTVEGSVAKALKDAKAFTTGEINTLVTTGKVKENADAIAILRGADTVEGSVAKALKDAKAYADTKKKEATDYTDSEITELVGASGQVGKNTAAIKTLNANAETVGSVDYKIAQAVSNIEASIDTISESEISGLFTPVQS